MLESTFTKRYGVLAAEDEKAERGQSVILALFESTPIKLAQ
jgi:hypothetical protein